MARTDKALAANKFSLASLGGTQASDGSGGRVRDKVYNGMRRGMFTNNPSLESMDNLPQTIKDAQSKTWDALTSKDAGNHLETFERAYGNNEAGLNSITSSIARLYLGDGPVAQSYQSTDALMDMDTANANLTTAKDVFLEFNEPGLKLTGHLLEHLQHRQSVKQDFITPDDLMSDLKHFKDPGE